MKPFSASIEAAILVETGQCRTAAEAARRFGVTNAQVGVARSLMAFERAYAQSVPEKTAQVRVLLHHEPDILMLDLAHRIGLDVVSTRKIARSIRFAARLLHESRK